MKKGNDFINRGFKIPCPSNQTSTVVTKDMILFQGLGDNARPLNISDAPLEQYLEFRLGFTYSLSRRMKPTIISNMNDTIFSFAPNSDITTIDSYSNCLVVKTIGNTDNNDS